MTEIYLHIVARMAYYIATHPYLSEAGPWHITKHDNGLQSNQSKCLYLRHSIM